jgi:mono/diheme cytochrome c family protein
VSKSRNALTGFAVLAGVLALAASALADKAPRYNFGTPVASAQIAPWNIDVNGLTGAGLPPGHGSVSDGAKIWEGKCASCHGEFGEGAGRFPVLAGGAGSLKEEVPQKTVGSFWPYAPTLFDYIKRAMPFPAPESLSNDEVYALTAYILNLNDIVPKTATMDATSLGAIKMPNRNGFIKAQWDTKNVACMSKCKPAAIKVTSDLVNLHVTPDEKEIGNVGSSVDLATVEAATAAPAGATAATAGAAAKAAGGPAKAAPAAAVTFATVAPIIATRCTVCHSAKPTQAGFSSAPMGIAFDTPAKIKAQAAQIVAQAVKSHSMPLGNMTHMTDKERALVGAWVAAGAPLP